MSFSIEGDRLFCDGRAVAFTQTPNVSGRIEPSGIVIHETAGHLTKGSAVSWLTNPKAKVSAHLVIERDGSITQLADFDRRTWHAGKSNWCGRSNCNAWMIGIELVGPGKLVKFGQRCTAWFGTTYDIGEYGLEQATTPAHGSGWWMPFTPEQIKATREVCEALADCYGIAARNIVAHYDISPGRKVDPCPLFDMDDLRACATPSSPSLPSVKLERGSRGEDVETAQMALKRLGYDLGPAGADGVFGKLTRNAVLAWEAENNRPTDGVIDQADMIALTSPASKSLPETPAVVEEKERIERSKNAVDTTSVVSLGLLGTGSLFPSDAWGMLMAELDRLSALSGKLVGLGVKIPPHLILATLGAIVVSILWTAARGMRGTQ